MQVRSGRLAPVALGIFVSAGCASSFEAADVRVPRVENPAAGPALRIGQVTDARVFERVARDGWGHSLRGGEPRDAARAIGRRRSGTGAFLGNVWLPDGRSVAQVVSEAVTRGFREAGYRVLEPDASGSADAPGIDLWVRRFWTRADSHFSGVAFYFWVEVWVRAPAPPYQGGAWACGASVIGRGGSTPGVWRRAAEKGLDDLATKLRSRLVSRQLLPYC